MKLSRKILFLTIACFSLLYSWGQININQKFLPKTKKGEEIVCHKAYCFVYSEEHEQAKWVAYKLTDEMLESTVSRNNKFIEDPLVESKTANNADYKGSGYDRGHLAPAADMCWSQLTMEESFYYSNISPQDPGFNRGMWKKLETEFRKYAENFGQVYIVTGPVLKADLPEIGHNGLDVPESYYKAVLYVSDTSYQAIAFVMPNEKIDSEDIYSYVCSIDTLEKLIGINLFFKLPFLIERKVEKGFDIDFWKLNN